MMVQVCNCGVKAVIAESLDGQLACLRCRGRAQASAEAKAHPGGSVGTLRPAPPQAAKAWARRLLTSATTAEGHARAIDVALANGMTRAEVSGLLAVRYQQAAEFAPSFELAKDECDWIRAALKRLDGAHADPAPSAEYAAECRACPACPDGICSRHHPDDREAALRAHPAPKAAPADPYEAFAVRRLDNAGRPCGPSGSLALALDRARERLAVTRTALAAAERDAASDRREIAELEAAIAEHGRKAGG